MSLSKAKAKTRVGEKAEDNSLCVYIVAIHSYAYAFPEQKLGSRLERGILVTRHIMQYTQIIYLVTYIAKGALHDVLSCKLNTKYTQFTHNPTIA